MATLSSQLDLDRCPHCGVNRPLLYVQYETETFDFMKENHRFWKIYCCNRCGGLTMGVSSHNNGFAYDVYPDIKKISEVIPTPAREYLVQAIESLSSPAGSVMLSASAIDAMLKIKNFTTGNLYKRIEAATTEHLITQEMAKWAHEVRLDANDQRHADLNAPLPTNMDAEKCLEFALALAEILFVLPARVAKGRGIENKGESA